MKVLEELKAKYPEIGPKFDTLKTLVRYLEDDVWWCEYKKLMDDLLEMGREIITVEEKMKREDAVKLLKFEDELLASLTKTLVEKCSCRK